MLEIRLLCPHDDLNVFQALFLRRPERLTSTRRTSVPTSTVWGRAWVFVLSTTFSSVPSAWRNISPSLLRFAPWLKVMALTERCQLDVLWFLSVLCCPSGVNMHTSWQVSFFLVLYSWRVAQPSVSKRKWTQWSGKWDWNRNGILRPELCPEARKGNSQLASLSSMVLRWANKGRWTRNKSVDCFMTCWLDGWLAGRLVGGMNGCRVI